MIAIVLAALVALMTVSGALAGPGDQGLQIACATAAGSHNPNCF